MNQTRNILLLAFSLLFFTVSKAQNYRFLNYGAAEKLCDNFIYNVIQDADGYLWLGTGEGVCRFDGINFVSVFQGDTLPSTPVKTSFRDNKGRIWFGFDNGQIALREESGFRLITPPDDYLSSVNGISQDSKGRIIVATQNKGIIRIDTDFQLEFFSKGLEGQFISSLELTTKDDLLIGTFDGLFLFRFLPDDTGVELIGRFEDIPYSNVQAIVKKGDKNDYYIGTEDMGLYYLTTHGADIQSYVIEKIGDELGLAYTDITDIHQDTEKNLWVTSGGEGIFRLQYSVEEDRYTEISQYNEDNGLNSGYVETVFADAEGNLWFGSYGAGLSVLKEQALSFYVPDNQEFGENVLSLTQVDGTYWLGGESAILITDFSGKNDLLIDSRYGLPSDRIQSLYYDGKGYVWAGTVRSGLYRISTSTYRVSRYFRSQNTLENSINDIIGLEDSLWVATNGGVFHFVLTTGKRKHFTTIDLLPHNKVRSLYMDSSGDIWVATRSNGLYNLSDQDELQIDIPSELEFISLTEDGKGDLWAVTNGDGVFEFKQDSPGYYSTNNGLRSNFGYSIETDINGNVWIGHRQGLSRIDPATQNIEVFSLRQGILADFNENAVITSRSDKLLFGSSNGVIQYDPFQDKPDTVAPMLNITSLEISDEEYDYTEPVFLPYGIYKIRIEFIGINLKNPEEVMYQYKLDGYDDWSEPSPVPYVNYSRVEDGNYTFMLRACDESGVCTEQPLTLDINVKIPVWKTWWFILTVIVVMIATVYIIIKVRERRQKQIQEYLQKALDERTREVMMQKEEIENKNRDITDSINYAQRIQASILPPVKRLEGTFTGSFVFYQPRDIVSGDFYWYDKVWGDKFVIVCADSTGHGVPGAFMSMIGTTLIKDICSRPEVSSPSEILDTLDQEIQEALNQNLDAEKSNDGMDIIVAEIDLKSNYLRVASAMRPIILYIDGEQVYVKGSRNSVGGRFDEEVEEKTFRNEGFQLSRGDLVYMFSDGYPDQFGGPLGKKFKMVRLKNLLRDIHDKPMDEQYNYVKSNFMLWKEDLEQVDDVLFMGIQI